MSGRVIIGAIHSGRHGIVLGEGCATPSGVLVSEGSERRLACITSGLPRTHIRRNGFVAEIITDRRQSSLFHCIIQREDSEDVLWLSQWDSFDQAKNATEKRLSELSVGLRKRA